MQPLSAEQVQTLQNSEPTDWAKMDAQLQDRSNWDTNRFAGDSKLHVKFFSKAYRNDEKSMEANRPIYEDKDCIQIMVPGDKHNIVIRPVWDQDLQRWPKLWADYKAGRAQVETGTPLKQAPFMTESLCEELAYMNIRTVEQLANLSDSHMGWMGSHDLKRAANEFLKRATSTETLLARMEQMEAANRELMVRLTALSSAAPQTKDQPKVLKGLDKTLAAIREDAKA